MKQIQKYNSALSLGTSTHDAFITASKNANTATLELLKSANGSIITNDQLSVAIDKTTLSAKLASTALKGLGAAGGMLAFAAVTAAVSAAAKAIDDYIHRNEILLEKAQESSQKIQEISENFQSQRELVESCAASYDRLSAGIDLSTNENVSLSTEEYAEFLRINNQIAELFPSLTTGIDANGNAILRLGTNGKTASESLNSLLKKEQEIVNYKIAEELPSVFEGFSVSKKDMEKEIASYQETLDTLSQKKSFLSENHSFDFNTGDMIRFPTDTPGAVELYNLWNDSLKKMKIDPDDTSFAPILSEEYFSTGSNFVINTSALFEKNVDELKEALSKASQAMKLALEDEIAKTESKILDAKTRLQLLWNDMLPSIHASISSSVNYQNLAPEGQELVGSLINGIDFNKEWDSIQQSGGIDSYIRDKILYPIAGAKPEMEEAFTKLFDMDFSTVTPEKTQELDQLIKTLAEHLEMNADDLKIRLGFDASGLESRSDESYSMTPEAVSTSWSSINSEIDAIQSAYQAISAAQQELDQNGALSMDTLQGLMALNSEYLACLMNENGQLVLNGETYQQLMQAKLADAKATAIEQAMVELAALTKNAETQASLDSVTANAALSASLAALSGDYQAVSKAAQQTAKSEALASALQNAEDAGASQESIQKVMDGLNAKLELINSTSIEVNTSFKGMNTAVRDYGNTASAATTQTDALTESLNRQKEQLEEEKKSLEEQKQHYEDVLSAVQWFYDKKIEGVQESINALEKENTAFEKQLSQYDQVLRAIDRVYEAEIKSVQAQKDAIQDKIDALQNENDAYEKQIALEKAQAELERARQQRSQYVFNGQEFVYTQDGQAIADAEQTIADLEYQQKITELQNEQLALDSTIAKLEEYRQKWADISSSYQIAEDNRLASMILGNDWESMILHYESLQAQWDDIVSRCQEFIKKIKGEITHALLHHPFTKLQKALQIKRKSTLAILLSHAELLPAL